MVRIFEYYARYQGVRGRMAGLPGWGRALLGLAALPGLVLLGLSAVAFAVSIIALLVLTVPVYRLLSVVLGLGRSLDEAVVDPAGGPFPDRQPPPQAGRRQVDVRIVDEPARCDPQAPLSE